MTAELHLELKGDKIPEETDRTSFIFNKCTGEDWAWIPRLGAVLDEKEDGRQLGFQLIPMED